MNITKPWKIVVGVLTALVLIGPLCLVAGWFGFIFSSIPQFETGDTPPPAFFAVFFTLFPAIIIINLLYLGTQIFYLAHIIMAREGSETLRVLAAVGLLVLPFVAMPVYYFVFVWPEKLPEGVRQTQFLTTAPASPEPPAPAPTLTP